MQILLQDKLVQKKVVIFIQFPSAFRFSQLCDDEIWNERFASLYFHLLKFFNWLRRNGW